MRKLNRILIAIFVFTLLVFGLIIYFDRSYKSNLNLNVEQDSYVLVVEEGESISSLIPKLVENGVVKSEFFTKIHTRLNKEKYASINPGEYELKSGMKLDELFTELTTKVEEAEFVVLQLLDGYTVEDYALTIAELMGDTSLQSDIIAYWDSSEYVNHVITTFDIVSEDVLNPDIYHPLEGYIKPDTYHFDLESFTIENLDYITDHIVNYRQDDFDDILSSGATYTEYVLNPHDVITLASIVDREAKGYEERQMVAGVFINRLKAGDRLGSDVTTYYGIGVKLEERDLTIDDINSDNGYNTRGDVYGLPVGPVNNPSRESINAVFNYIPNDYYYFVSDKNGEMYYTKTFEEHTNIIEQLKNDGLWFEYEE